jgi:CxxC motif-containing protein (DUF1111 family)
MKQKLIYKASFLMMLTTFFVVACADLEPLAPADEDILDGPIADLTHAQNSQFIAGDVAFNDEVFTVGKGLGPVFVATSCGSCHAGDGKGTPFTTLTRFGQVDETGNKFLHLGGPQLQHRGIPGFMPEVIPLGATSSKFTPPANTGLGFIEYVTDAIILAMADPNDANGDGISGVPNWNTVPDYVSIHKDAIVKDDKYICRFGKKASTYDLLQQTVTAYNEDMGITSSFNAHDVYTGYTIKAEVSDKTIRDVVAYLQMLKAPIQRNKKNIDVLKGQNLFMELKCSSCHTPQIETGYSPIKGLSYRTFFPYSDLLLHDMGSGLDDGYTEGSAKTYEWRTPPLWGLGLSPGSQGGKYFLMHDGRAKTIEQAIEMHGGEATRSKNNFMKMTQSDKIALVRFLESL